MFLLRRAASRAISASPSKSILTQPRSITTFTPSSLRIRQQQWSIAGLQRRFASDEAAKTEAAQAAAADSPDNFAQTAAEAPIEDGLTPAQQEAQAPPTDSQNTAGAAALNAAAEGPLSSKPREKRGAPPAANKTLYVGNLFYEVKEEQLTKVFSRFGEVESVNIISDNRGLSRGFAYVNFKEINDAQSAIDHLDMQVFEGRNLVVQFHSPKPNSKTRTNDGGFAQNSPSKTLFIGNMSFEMSDKDLNDLFRDIRNVMDVRVAIDRRTGQPRGFAHADFVDVTSATKAREVLKEKTIYGRQLRVDFSKSTTTPREGRGERGDRGDRSERRERREPRETGRE